MKTLGLNKAEKLRHKRLVEKLFEEGNSFYDFPIRMTWRALSQEELKSSFRSEIPQKIDRLQMLITVPKRKRRHAVDRVLLRRRIREAYRLNRIPLKNSLEKHTDIALLEIAFIYLTDTNQPYSLIEKKIKRLLTKLQQTINAE